MSAHDVVSKVRAAGGTIRPVGEWLELEAPAPLPEDLIEQIRACKPEILAALRRSATVIPFARRYGSVHAGFTADGAEIRRIVNYTYAQMREDGMGCCDRCAKCKRNGGYCRRADLQDKPHRCGEFQPIAVPDDA